MYADRYIRSSEDWRAQLQVSVEVWPSQAFSPLGSLPHEKDDTAVQDHADDGHDGPRDAPGRDLGEGDLLVVRGQIMTNSRIQVS